DQGIRLGRAPQLVQGLGFEQQHVGVANDAEVYGGVPVLVREAEVVLTVLLEEQHRGIRAVAGGERCAVVVHPARLVVVDGQVETGVHLAADRRVPQELLDVPARRPAVAEARAARSTMREILSPRTPELRNERSPNCTSNSDSLLFSNRS